MPHTKLIYLTMNSDPDIASEALRAGGSAYLLKTSQVSELLQAVHNVIIGILYVTPQISRAMEERFIVDPRRPHGPKHLTGMPCEVLQMLAEGRSMKEIAFVLQIAHRTVRFHKSRILEELGFTTNLDLVKCALKHGMISSA